MLSTQTTIEVLLGPSIAVLIGGSVQTLTCIPCLDSVLEIGTVIAVSEFLHLSFFD